MYEFKDECKECNSGFFKNENNVCTKYPQLENCIKTNESKSECLECAFGYFLTANKICLQTQKLKNCKDFDNKANMCKECFIRFDLDSENSCQPDNCFEYDKELKCKRCNDNFALNEDTKKCKFFENNKCITFSGKNTRCTLCKKNYYLNPDSGYECFAVNHVENCDYYVENENLCEKCNDSFLLIDGKCFEKILECTDYNEKGLCIKCKNDKPPINSICIDKNTQIGVMKTQYPKIIEEGKEEEKDIYKTFNGVFSILFVLSLIIIMCFVLKFMKLCCFKDDSIENGGNAFSNNSKKYIDSKTTVHFESEKKDKTATNLRSKSNDQNYQADFNNEEEVELSIIKEDKRDNP